MSESTTSESLTEADRLELARLVIEVSWRIDHGQAARVHELFAEDGELVLGPDDVLRGRQAIEDWGTRIDQLGWRIRHVSTNLRLMADGPDAALGTSLVTAYMSDEDHLETTVPWTVGEDHDRFIRTTTGWRLGSRRWEQLFTRAQG